MYGYIYGLRNKTTNKWYIGQTVQHPLSYITSSYKVNGGGNRRKLKNAIDKYGFDDFDVCLLDSAVSAEELNEKEIAYMKEYDSQTNGYNIRHGGLSGKHSDETKAKIGQFNKGNKVWLGKHHTEESKAKMCEVAKLRGNNRHRMTQETLNTVREKARLQMTGENNPHYGKPMSKEAKAKMIAKKIGKPSPRKGVKLSEETKAKLREAALNHK